MYRRAHARGLALAAAFVAAAALPSLGGALLPLEAYLPIVERHPFGELAKPPEKAPPPVSAEETQMEQQREALARQIDLVAINVTLRGTVAVGFVDKSAKPSRSIYLNIGESEAGFTVEAADYAAETATISKDGVRITLKLGSGVVSETAATPAATAAAPAAPAQPAAAPSPAAPPAGMPKVIRRPAAGIRPGGYRSMLAERKQSEEAAVAAEETRRRDEAVALAREAADASAAKREHDMNFKLLLEGKDPVSEIRLTPEEEAELVKRGLLTPEADNGGK